MARDRRHSLAISGNPDSNAADANDGCSRQGKNDQRLCMDLMRDEVMFVDSSSLLLSFSIGSFFPLPLERPWCIGLGNLGDIAGQKQRQTGAQYTDCSDCVNTGCGVISSNQKLPARPAICYNVLLSHVCHSISRLSLAPPPLLQ